MKSETKRKCIVVFSGGMDSITLLNLVKAEGYEVHGLSFNYGQKHKKELKYAEKWARELCESWKLIGLDFMKDVAGNSALMKLGEIPREHYTHENQKQTVVPNRNMVMISIGVALAENIGAEKVFFGAHKNDRAIYPDCRAEFVEAVSKCSALATFKNVTVEAPFVDMFKWQIARIGNELGVDFEKTWSCYEGEDRHCGECGTCQERKEAFKLAGLPDPTKYEKY